LATAVAQGAASARALDIIDYCGANGRPKGVELVIYEGRTVPLPSQSVDVIWAWDCFEHIRFPALTIEECGRVLRPGGRLICDVDIRDHRSWDESKYGDAYLYPSWLWNLMMWNRGAYTNRVVLSRWRELFRSAGLGEIAIEERRSEVSRLKWHQDRRFRAVDVDDFATIGFRAVLEKRAGG
jgi:SAM-dependent methyltransferase